VNYDAIIEKDSSDESFLKLNFNSSKGDPIGVKGL